MFHKNLRRLLFTESIGVNYIRPTNSVLSQPCSFSFSACWLCLCKVSLYYTGVFYFSLPFYQFLPHSWMLCCQTHTREELLCFVGKLTSLPLYNTYFSPDYSPCFEVCLSEINIPILDIVQLVFARYIFLYPFTFNPYGSLGL